MTLPPKRPHSTGAKPKPRGFATMTAEKRQEIARMGGAAVPAEKRAFSQDPTLARAAGAKGGQNVDGKNRSFSRDRKLASAAGKKGRIKRPQE